MTPARWNEIIATAAATAIDECGDTPTIQKVARKAAELAAEWIAEELAKDDAEATADEIRGVVVRPGERIWVLNDDAEASDA